MSIAISSANSMLVNNGDANGRLRVAIPNKGALSEASRQLLIKAGYRQRADPRELMIYDTDTNAQFFYLRPKDIAVYVGAGRIDLGITGRDLLLDAGVDAIEALPLHFGQSTFRYAAPRTDIATIDDLAGRRIATSYPGLVKRDLTARNITAEVITLDGAVENAVRLGVADAVADVVETGRTLQEAGLAFVGEPILHSEAVLTRQRTAPVSKAEKQLIRRLQGVLVAARYAMIEYDVELEKLDAAALITPGIESPTVAPLHHPGWVAVRAMVLKNDANAITDELADLGARAIIVTDIRICRL